MYSGLLPKGFTEEDLSPDEEQDDPEEDAVEETEAQKSAAELNSVRSLKKEPEMEEGKTLFATEAETDTQTCPMPGISQGMWQKFQNLCKKSEEAKKIKFTRRPKRRRSKKAGPKNEESVEISRKSQTEQEKHWGELKQYFGVNDRFQPPPCSKPPPKSGLEKSTERAIAEGDIAKAEEMSDRLATRELAVKIANAADCRDFVQRKQEEEALRAAQKRKKEIAWGFEAKKRWETKSNMGYM